MKEERKRDIEETADFVKQVIEQQRKDTSVDLSGVRNELEKVRDEFSQVATLKDMQEFHKEMSKNLEAKIEVKEV